MLRPAISRARTPRRSRRRSTLSTTISTGSRPRSRAATSQGSSNRNRSGRPRNVPREKAVPQNDAVRPAGGGEMSEERILVAGGGIGGLSTALALAEQGFQVTVLERASRYQEIGAGIQLGPNAFHAFDRLKLGDAIRSIAVFIDHLRLMDARTAEEITHIDLTTYFRTRFGNPYAVVHRGELHTILLRACHDHAAITLRADCDVIGYDQTGGSVTALMKSGERVPGSALIGADGLRSKIRQQMVGDG